ncbi:MAG: cell wall-binding repeat-containing protein [Firmicutes bacterium]|nr:cell wall-binding repeat-containing protein [Kroppenstedtia guangzhouensis]MDA8353153.1 cell wall-binding repeat-containing protein [Bacillota bacterium]
MRKRRSMAIGAVLIFTLIFTGCSMAGNNSMDHKSMNMDHGKKDGSSDMGDMSMMDQKVNKGGNQNRLSLDMKNVTRIDQDDPVNVAVETSQLIWPASHEGNRPGTILLGVKGDWQTNLPAVTLVHHPNDGPLLYAEKNRIPKATMDELKRLNPKGSKKNQGIQVVLTGDFSDGVGKQLEDEGLKVDAVQGKNPADTAAEVDAYYAKASGDLPQSVIVGSMDAPEYTLPAANWIAHMPEPLLYVGKDEVPKETVDALKKRKDKPNIYILGPESAVSASVEKELKQYGKVKRISGNTPEENAIAFAKYKDKSTKFGWGVTNPGHGLTFNRTDHVESAIASAPFSHMGKHAPMLLLDQEKLSEPMHHYLMSLQPKFKDDPTVGPYNHAFVIGSEKTISFTTQGMIDQMLEIVPESGGGHGGH